MTSDAAADRPRPPNVDGQSELDMASAASATGDATAVKAAADIEGRERFATPTSAKERGKLYEALAVLGPGLITGAADDDPSGIGTYAQAGAGFGFAQLWLVLYMLPLMIAVQEMCGRIGIVTRQGVAGIVRQHYSRGVLYPAVALVFVANTINLFATGAMGIASAVTIFSLVHH